MSSEADTRAGKAGRATERTRRIESAWQPAEPKKGKAKPRITEGKAQYINRRFVKIEWLGYDIILWEDGHIGTSLPVKLVKED